MKRALIVANLAGFASFLINDILILQDLGYQIDFAANGLKFPWGETKEKLDKLNVSFLQIDFNSKHPFAKENFSAYRQLQNLILKNHYDLIHCHTPIAGLITRLAARKIHKNGVKVLYTTHGFAFHSKTSKKTWLIYYSMEKFASHFCDAMITINHEDFDNAKKMHCKNVFYIHGVGVNVKKYHDVEIDRAAYRKSIGVPEGQIMILSIGELSDRKNHKVIVDAVGGMSDKNRYTYVVCGAGIEGDTGKQLEQRAKEKGVNLQLLGFRTDIPQIIACSDIGAIPSKREGLGWAGIQSLGGGVPLVGSNVQGIREYVVDGKTGYLCDPNDSIAFAKAISRLAQRNEKEKEDQKEECYKMALKFDISISREEIRKIYNQILE
mgnify:CR=1 FL=1